MKSGRDLFAIELKSAFKVFAVRSKNGNSAGTIAVFAFLFVMLSFSLFSTGIAFLAVGSPSLVLAEGFLMALYLVVILSLSTTAARLFASSDYELLASLPLTKTRIVATKVLAIYVANLIVTVVIGSVSFWIFKFMVNLSTVACLQFGLLTNLVLLALPMLPMALTGLLGYLASLLKGKVSPLVRNILYLAVFAGLFIAMMAYSSTGASLATVFLKIPTVRWAYGFLEGSLESGVWFFLSSIGSFVLFIWLSSLSYTRINERTSATRKTRKVHFSSKANSSLSRDLYAREWKRLGSNITIFSETLMPAVIGVIMIFVMKSAFTGEESLPQVFQVPVYFLFASLLGGTQPPSARLASLEGKSFSLLKSLPLSGKTLSRAKIAYGETIIAIEAVLFSAAITIVTKSSLLMAGALAIGLFGLFTLSNVRAYVVDLRDPKLTWDNPAEILKQSSRTLVNLALSFLFGILMTALVYVASYYGGTTVLVITLLVLGMAMGLLPFLGFDRKVESAYAAIDA